MCDPQRQGPYGPVTRKQYLRNHGKLHEDIRSVFENGV